MSVEFIKCIKIGVDCVKNDPVDIRCGGPNFLGFNFLVKEEDFSKMVPFITETLQKCNIPFLRIYANDTVDAQGRDVWSQEMILNHISKEAEFLIDQSERSYHFPFET